MSRRQLEVELAQAIEETSGSLCALVGSWPNLNIRLNSNRSALPMSKGDVIGQAAALMYALNHATFTHIHCGDYVGASAVVDELVGLANEKGSLF
jgi:hypothetical protein